MTQLNLLEERGATISDDGLYRYDLTRRWDLERPMALWIMLNPSTADGETDDNTIGRVRSYTERADRGGFVVVNLFAFRSSTPSTLAEQRNPVGNPTNGVFLRTWITSPLVDLIVVAWGAFPLRSCPTRSMVPRLAAQAGRVLHCLGTTKDGAPRHPLYLAKSEPLLPWRPA